ncbi:MAG: class I SAM-dependent methyltransferase, partial [Deltaproteobacteria bacterium]|nr:class I SAM-dependent methyltransferase [Deltaproteobacteria bacterium]
MGYVFDFNDAIYYEKRLNDPKKRFAADLEKRLMLNALKPARGETILDISCGTGFCLQTFLDIGLQVTGLDPS